jgi:hypothetical protein
MLLAPRDGLLGAARLALRVAVARPPAINLACGQVVEPSFCLSAVRISTARHQLPKLGIWAKKKLAPRDGSEMRKKKPAI